VEGSWLPKLLIEKERRKIKTTPYVHRVRSIMYGMVCSRPDLILLLWLVGSWQIIVMLTGRF